jgi:hypothetical protein
MLSLDSELVKAGLESITTPAGKGKSIVVTLAPGATRSFRYRLNLTTILRRAVEMPERLPAWPEEGGGTARLVAIMRRLIELQEDPSLERRFPKEDVMKNYYLTRNDIGLYELIKPEISRQKTGIVNACQRVVDLVWSYDSDLTRDRPRSISAKIATLLGRWSKSS